MCEKQPKVHTKNLALGVKNGFVFNASFMFTLHKTTMHASVV